MEVARTSEMSVDIQLRTRQYIPEDSDFQVRVSFCAFNCKISLSSLFGKWKLYNWKNYSFILVSLSRQLKKVPLGYYETWSSSRFNTGASDFSHIYQWSASTLKLNVYLLFADDTNIIISHPEIDSFPDCMNDVFASLNKWIKANKLTLYFDKTSFMKLCTNNKTCVNINVGYNDKTIEKIETAQFYVLQIKNNLNWKTHSQYSICKLSSPCCAMRAVTSLMKTENLKLVYFA
jgi:hypothetical protein